jgi:hypothetical protein
LNIEEIARISQRGADELMLRNDQVRHAPSVLYKFSKLGLYVSQ